MVGMNHSELPDNWYTINASAINADGTVIVGSGSSTNGVEAFRWTIGGEILGLGDLAPGMFRSEASDVSADGNVIVGNSWVEKNHLEAFRWTMEDGMIGLGDLKRGVTYSRANGVSATGNVIVGLGHSTFCEEAFRWNKHAGMQGLGFLKPGRGTEAHAVNADGSVVVGVAVSPQRNVIREAFRWTSRSGMAHLEDINGKVFVSAALGVNADGSIVVGYREEENSRDSEQAFVWDDKNGMRRLTDVLIAAGTDLSGWKLLVARAVSDDGSVIVGSGRNPEGNMEAWRVTGYKAE